jgi:hypothetical protein
MSLAMGGFLVMSEPLGRTWGGAPGARAAGASARFACAARSGSAPLVHRREVDLGLRDLVDVIGQRVEGDVNHDFHDFRVAPAGVPHVPDRGVGHVSPGAGDARGKSHRRIGFRIVRAAVAVGGDLRLVQPRDVPRQVGVGREAVAAAVDLGDCEGDPLAGLRAYRTLGQRAAQHEVPAERGRAVAEDPHQVGHDAELFPDGVEKGTRCGGRLVESGGIDSGHGGSPRVVGSPRGVRGEREASCRIPCKGRICDSGN